MSKRLTYDFNVDGPPEDPRHSLLSYSSVTIKYTCVLFVDCAEVKLPVFNTGVSSYRYGSVFLQEGTQE